MGWMDLRGQGLNNMPGIPKPSFTEIMDTVVKLGLRSRETAPAEDGLSHQFTLGGHTASGKEFVFGGSPPGNLPLEHPEQFSMGWTTYKGVYQDGTKHLADYARTLTSESYANEQFWPMIAQHGAPYNLLILRKVTDTRFREIYPLLHLLGETFDPIHQQDRLYEIDFSIFESLGAWHYHGKPERFNPATLMLLEKHPTKVGVFEPKWIRVWSMPDNKLYEEFYSPYFSYHTPGAWLYALQAVKSAVTLYGIWLGHVYHWHMVTAAMQRTMHENLPEEHGVRKLLGPQSDYLIAFNYVLLDGAPLEPRYFINFEAIAPPSRIADVESFLKLTDKFAEGRQFFDDDPRHELAKNGLYEADFTVATPWDRYPAAQQLLRIWDICEELASKCVALTYADDHAVKVDGALQRWIKAAADPRQGNLRGLPVLNNRDALTRLVTSLIYRVTAHGMSRLVHTANPALTFVANFPPCLQTSSIPFKGKNLTTQELLKYLPNTTTIGDMLKFYFAFVFSKPYVPLLPSRSAGILAPDKLLPAPGFDLYYPGNILEEPRNAALARFRMAMEHVIGKENIDQWPRNIET